MAKGFHILYTFKLSLWYEDWRSFWSFAFVEFIFSNLFSVIYYPDRSAENSAVRKEEREPSYDLTAHA